MNPREITDLVVAPDVKSPSTSVLPLPVTKPSADPAEIVRALNLILEPGQVTELRALKVKDGKRFSTTRTGYFDHAHINDLAAEAARLTAGGIYFVPNPVQPELLARCANRLGTEKDIPGTQDQNILARHWLLIDCDPKRPVGISSSELEHTAALVKVLDICDTLRGAGWPEPIVADSGNGAHLLYSVDLSTDDGGLVKRCLQTLGGLFDDAVVQIDQTVFNPARIWKLYGTVAAKGDATAERPHRLSNILHAPAPLEIVPRQLLEELGKPFEKQDRAKNKPRHKSKIVTIDAGRWLDDWIANTLTPWRDIRGLPAPAGPLPWQSHDGKPGRKWVFPVCPWRPDHTDNSAFIVQFDDGAIDAGCQHDSCKAETWDSLRKLVEPGNQDEPHDPNDQGRNIRPADELILAADQAGLDLFHPANGEREGYASVMHDGHRENHRLDQTAFEFWLRRVFLDNFGRGIGPVVIQEAVQTLSARAVFSEQVYPVAVRLAEHDGAIWLDLCDDKWRAVKVTDQGWAVVDDPPVRFIRPRGLQPLPVPEQGGNLDLLRALVNVPDDDAWLLLCSFLVAAFRPGKPCPVLNVTGEQGSAKSSLCRMIKALIDPNQAPLRAEPREQRDFVITAKNQLLLAYDNLSQIPAWLSDAICRMSTGGGFATRELYANDSEIIFDALRPVLINGIEDLAFRSDLLDRTITITLPTMPEAKRRTEEAIWAAFNSARPRILGALLTALSVALRNLPTVNLPRLPRMADFARLSVAAEQALGFKAGSFMAAYGDNRAGAHDLALDASPLAPVLIGFAEQQGHWSGVSRELLNAINGSQHFDDNKRHPAGWPKDPRGLTGQLRRLAPNLRARGVEITFGRHGARGVVITIIHVPKSSSASSLSSRGCDVAGLRDEPMTSTSNSSSCVTTWGGSCYNGDDVDDDDPAISDNLIFIPIEEIARRMQAGMAAKSG